MQTLLAILTAILGEDHDMLGRVNGEPGDVEPTRWADYEGADETLAAFADVTDDEIRQAFAAIRAAAQDADGADLANLVEAGETLAFVIGARAEDEALAEEARAEALAALDEAAPVAADDTAADGPDDPPAEDGGEDGDGEDEGASDAAPAEPVAARQPSIGQMANRVPRPRQPLPTHETVEASQDGARFVLARDVTTPSGAYRSGQEVGYRELGDVVAATLDRHAAGKNTVARRLTHYDQERQLGSDVESNMERISAAQQAMMSHDPALMAAVCAPPTPIYDIRVASTTARPVRDFLPAFQATRGGVIFRPGLTFADAGTVNSDTSGVTAPWDDGDGNKNVLTVTCPSTETATISAIVRRAQISITQSRFDPESVAAFLRRQDAFWARVAENNLLDQIEAASTALTFDPVLIVGFARHFLLQINALAAAIRNRERMDPDAPLDLLAPAWVVNAVQDDLTLEHPGAAEERLATTQAQIEEWLRVRNIRVGWFLDGDFTFASQGEAEQVDYPQRAEMYMFEPGHHVFLDGGSLNIDTFYDSTLLNTNVAQTFFESFEAIAPVGVVSYTLQLNVCRTGTTGDGAEITCGEVS